MIESRADSEESYSSATDIGLWVKQEIADANRAHDLRVKELAEIARAYTAGEITPKQADKLHSRYYERWGDALPGISVGPGVTDEQILESLDVSAERHKSLVKARSSFTR